MTAPLPSTLIFLSDLPHTPRGSKVRFLGCVTKYSSSTGRVHLQHAYPTPSPGKEAVTVSAVVDVNLLIETLKSTDTQTGEWVNVIGYVGDKNSTGTRTARTEPGSKEVQVQALMVWSAGALRIEEYEKAVQGRKTSGGVT